MLSTGKCTINILQAFRIIKRLEKGLKGLCLIRVMSKTIS